jgi:hypothetical protein
VGLSAWNAQLFGEEMGKRSIVDNVMLYLLTGTVASAPRFYYGDPDTTNPDPTTVPRGAPRAKIMPTPHAIIPLIDVFGLGISG